MNRATEIAKLLLEIKAITFDFQNPYQFTSGLLSPIYCDNRLIISYPDKRRVVIEAFLELIQEKHLKFDAVAGIATAGIPHAAWIADRLNLPLIYLRSKPKTHGKRNQIEGSLSPQQKVLVVEDLISTGQSALNGALALRQNGAVVNDCVALFTYQFLKSHLSFSKEHIALHPLSDFKTLIEVARQNGSLSEEEYSEALKWSSDPEHWKLPQRSQ